MNDRIDVFLSHIATERGLSEHTVSAYRNDLTQFAQFAQAEAAREGAIGLPLSSIDRERLGGYLLHLRERGYAPATIARKVAALKSLFHYLRRIGEVASDPTEGLGSPEVKKEPPRTISTQEVRLLLEEARRRETPESSRDAAMLQLLYATGMRVSEVVMLDLGDLSLLDATVRVVGRGRRVRSLPLDAGSVKDLRLYVERARPYMVRNGVGQVALFVNHRGQRLTRQGFWLILKELVRSAGLTVTVTPHTLRHTFATHRLGSGVALPQLKELLGHASLSTTQVYRLTATPEAPSLTALPGADDVSSTVQRTLGTSRPRRPALVPAAVGR